MQISEMIKHDGGRLHDGERFLPWYTSPCLEWLMTIDLKGKRIFEYGVGDSTRWFRSRGAECVGVDSNDTWALETGAYYIRSDTKYPLSIYGNGDFDIVVNDGLWRDECTLHALENLKSGGYLILDNWLQPEVEPEWPKTERLIEGMPITIYKEPGHPYWQTAVIIKP